MLFSKKHNNKSCFKSLVSSVACLIAPLQSERLPEAESHSRLRGALETTCMNESFESLLQPAEAVPSVDLNTHTPPVPRVLDMILASFRACPTGENPRFLRVPVCDVTEVHSYIGSQVNTHTVCVCVCVTRCVSITFGGHHIDLHSFLGDLP